MNRVEYKHCKQVMTSSSRDAPWSQHAFARTSCEHFRRLELKRLLRNDSKASAGYFYSNRNSIDWKRLELSGVENRSEWECPWSEGGRGRRSLLVVGRSSVWVWHARVSRAAPLSSALTWQPRQDQQQEARDFFSQEWTCFSIPWPGDLSSVCVWIKGAEVALKKCQESGEKGRLFKD